jgi:hypothetical protein
MIREPLKTTGPLTHPNRNTTVVNGMMDSRTVVRGVKKEVVKKKRVRHDAPTA